MAEEDLETRWHELLFGVRKSIRYHVRRRKYFDTWHRVIVFFSIFGGTAAFTALVSGAQQGSWFPYMGMWAAAMIAALNALDLVVGFSRKGWEHADLARRFALVEHDMAGLQRTEKNYTALVKRRLTIEAEEPPIMRLLDLLADNELRKAMGYDDEWLHDLKWYHRLMAQFCSFGVEGIGYKESATDKPEHPPAKSAKVTR